MSRNTAITVAGLNRLHAPTTVSGTTYLNVVEQSLRRLSDDPDPLSVDGRRVGHGLPRRLIRLTELSSILMHPATSYTSRDEVWCLLVSRARTHGQAWAFGAMGVALPALRAAAHRLSTSNVVDVQAELLTGFAAALASIDVMAPRVCARLCNAAFVTARAALRREEPPMRGW
jgi:hypothetical protein